MNIFITLNFNKSLKKLHRNQKKYLDEAIRNLCKNPLCGELKKGNLSGIRVYKFQVGSLLTLLAYQYNAQTKELILLKMGSHENFYRDLKKRHSFVEHLMKVPSFEGLDLTRDKSEMRNIEFKDEEGK